MFNGKKIEEIMATTYEMQTEIREMNTRFARASVTGLERKIQAEKDFTILNDKLNELSTDIDVIAKGMVNIIKSNREVIANQEQLLKNQAKYIPLKKRPRKKALTNATGWTKVHDDEIVTFMEMYDAEQSITAIAGHTGRGASTVSKYITIELEKRDNEAAKTKA